MIKDFLVSFSDNFKEKTKNPFLGTYLLVWLIRNWELIYTIFNFDNDCVLTDKLHYFNNYFSTHNFVENLFINIYYSFIVLILTYILLNLSRFIVNYSEKQITPWIYKVTDSKSIVLKSTFDNLRLENDNLLDKLDKERDSKSRLEMKIKSLENEIAELLSSNLKEVSEVISNPNRKNEIETTNLSAIFLQKLKDKNLLSDFKSTCVSINKGQFINNDYRPVDYFIELGLIKFKESSHSGTSKKYIISEEGENLLKLIRLE